MAKQFTFGIDIRPNLRILITESSQSDTSKLHGLNLGFATFNQSINQSLFFYYSMTKLTRLTRFKIQLCAYVF